MHVLYLSPERVECDLAPALADAGIHGVVGQVQVAEDHVQQLGYEQNALCAPHVVLESVRPVGRDVLTCRLVYSHTNSVMRVCAFVFL